MIRYSLLLLPFLLLAATSAEEEPPRPRFQAQPRGVLRDAKPNGTLWVKGVNYKMNFHEGRATYFPLFSPKADRHWPLEFRLALASFGQAPLTLAAPARIREVDDGVDLDHGSLIERWSFKPDRVEQDFLLLAGGRPQDADLILTLALETQLGAPTRDELGGLVFTLDGLGQVRYGEVHVFDEAGREVVVPVMPTNRALTITVPARFLAEATGTVTIDPVVQTFVIDVSSPTQGNPDASYEGIADVWLVVYEEEVNALDTDVIARRFRRDGSFLDEVAVAIGLGRSTYPAVASLRRRGEFMVVWQEPGLLTTNIMGRTRIAVNTTQGNTQVIRSGAPLGVANSVYRPDLGGSPNVSAAGYYLIWHTQTLIAQGIQGALLSSAGTLSNVTSIGLTSFSPDNGRVTKTCGPGGHWVVAYQKDQIGGTDISVALVDESGTVLDREYDITNSASLDQGPDVAGDGNEFLVVWTHTDAASNADVFGRRLRASGNTFASLTGALDLTAGEPLVNPGDRQASPRVSAHGCRYLYTYSEGPLSGPVRPYGAVVVGQGTTLVHLDGHLALSQGPGPIPGGLATLEESGLLDHELLALVTLGDGDVYGVLVEPTRPDAGVSRVRTDCGGLRFRPDIALDGIPGLGTSVRVTLQVGASSLPFLIVGLPTLPVPLCQEGCQLGVFPILGTFAGGRLVLPIPCDPALGGVPVAIQGLELLPATSFSCGPPSFPVPLRTSETLHVIAG